MVVNVSDYLTNTTNNNPRTSQLNDLVERMNKNLMGRVRCLLSKEKLPNSYWGEALLTATYVINLSPSIALQSDVPNRFWCGKYVFYDHLRVFGCKEKYMCPKMRGQS